MSSIHAQCPSNSTFFACDYGTRFLGCCLSTLSSNEVCGTGCLSSSLTSLSFEKEYYNQVTTGACGSSEGKWYTCPDTDPPFLGCCKSNPCQAGGCQAGALVPASLSEDQAQQAAYAPVIEGPTTTSGGVATSSSVPITSSVSFISTATPDTTTSPKASVTSSAAATSSEASSAPSTAVTVGAVLGGLLGGIFLSLAIAILFIFYKRRKTSRRRADGRKGLGPIPCISTLVLTCLSTDSDQLDILPRSTPRSPTSTCHEMSSDRETHELHSTSTPPRELASKEIPPTVHELPSPVPSAFGLHLKRSTSSFGGSQREVGTPSPSAGPYQSDGAATVSDIDLPATSIRDVR